MAKINIPGFDPSKKIRAKADLKYKKTNIPQSQPNAPESGLRLQTQDEIDVAQAGQDWLNSALQELAAPSPGDFALDAAQEVASTAAEKVATSSGNPILNAAFKIATKLSSGLSLLGQGALAMGYSSELNEGEDEQLARMKTEYEAKQKLYNEQNKINSDPLEFTYVPPKATEVPVKKVTADSKGNLMEQIKTPQPTGTVFQRLRPGERVVALFGNLQESVDEKGNKVIVEVPRQDPVPAIINTDDVLRRQAEKSQNPSIDEQLAKLTKMEGPERIEASIGTLQMVEESMAKRLAQLTAVAESQVGYNEARQNLELNKAEDVKTGFTIRRPGALSSETAQAHDLVNQTQLQAQRTLQNLLLTDPEYQKLEAISKNLNRWQQAAGVMLAAKSEQEAKYGWIDENVITAYKLAFDADTSDVQKVKGVIYERGKKDETFRKIVNINKENIISALGDSDIVVRQAAWKIAYNGEKALGNDTTLIDALRPIVNRREDILPRPGSKQLTKEQKEALNRDMLTTSGTKEKAQRYQENLLPLIYEAVGDHAVAHYSDMAKWNTGNDPELNRIVNDVKIANNGKAKFKDVFNIYLSRDIPQAEFQKRQQLVAQALTSTLKMDRGSWIIPNKEAFHAQVMASVNSSLQQHTAGYLLQKLGKPHGAIAGIIDFAEGVRSIVDGN